MSGYFPTHPHRWQKISVTEFYCPNCRRFSPTTHNGNCPAPDPKLVADPIPGHPDRVMVESPGLTQKLEDLSRGV